MIRLSSTNDLIPNRTGMVSRGEIGPAIVSPRMKPPLKIVMSVEDDPDIQLVIRMSLASFGGLKLEECLDAEEALERVKTVKPDLLLLDYRMPGMDGPTLLGRFRAMPELKEVPVVFLTASVGEETKKLLKNLGALDVWEKPYDPTAMPERLRRLWDAWPGPNVA